MSAGELRERVAFDRREDTAPDGDGHGNYTGEWLEQFKRAAEFTFLQGGEEVIAARLDGVQPVVVKLRRDANTRLITAAWRMRDTRDITPEMPTGREYAIASVKPTASAPRAYLDILCKSGTPA